MKLFKTFVVLRNELAFRFQDDPVDPGRHRVGRRRADRLVRLQVLQKEEAKGQREGQERFESRLNCQVHGKKRSNPSNASARNFANAVISEGRS